MVITLIASLLLGPFARPCQCSHGDCKVIRNKDIINIQNRQGYKLSDFVIYKLPRG